MNKNYEQARDLSQELLKNTAVHQNRIQAQYYLGISQVRLGQYVEARSLFQIVMSMAEDQDLHDRAALGMIEALYKPGLYQDALKTTKELLEKNPKSSFLSLIYLKKARIYLKLSQWAKAKEYLQRVIEEFPKSIEAPIAQDLMEEKEHFAVQVGAYLDKEIAIKLTEDLKAKGQYAYIIETVSSENKKFYRVRVGQTTSILDAQTLESKLCKLGYPTLICP
jgi:tetratricopeptide (TPR) repeat protein